MFNEPAQEQQKISAFRRLTQQINDYSRQDLLSFNNSNDLLQLIVSQNALINSLFQRQQKMQQELQVRIQNQKNSSGSENKETKGSKVYGQRKLAQQEIFNSGSPEEGNPYLSKKSVKIIQKVRNSGSQNKVLINNDFDDESSSSVFEGQSNSDLRNVKPSFKKKQAQTKNMVKNFAKAIFNYIRKNKDKRDRVLNYLGIREEEFMTVYSNLKGKVHSILQLRRLWTPEGNIYHKAFRILSNEYLRKNCLGKTFNSRVENYQVHMKYRERLLESLKQPESFTILKTN